MANTKVTSRVLANDAVLTANITDANITTAKIADNAVTGDKVADDVALAGNPTTTTQTAGNNTTRIATTAFVTTAVANIVDSAPSALDTLNELAAALGDDANFSTTVTNSIATKAPLASPTFTGDAVFDTTTLVVDATNNRVGIGTASPSTKLHLGGTAPLDSIIRQDSTSSGTNWEIGERAAGKWQIFEDDNDSIVATFMSTGKVGIGTTSPQAHLDINTETAEATTVILNGENYLIKIKFLNLGITPIVKRQETDMQDLLVLL